MSLSKPVVIYIYMHTYVHAYIFVYRHMCIVSLYPEEYIQCILLVIEVIHSTEPHFIFFHIFDVFSLSI